jgi:dephospho-CoA kinase
MRSFKEFLAEGIQDEKYPFKAVFMAGGPGSGKSFIAHQMFSGMGFKFANSDSILELFSKRKNIPLDFSNPDTHQLMANSFTLNSKRASLWQDSGLPIVIDITSRKLDLVQQIKKTLEDSGYDTLMIFVNTNLSTAIKRNKIRDRTVDHEFLIQSWRAARENFNELKALFGHNFHEIENNSDVSDIKKVAIDLHRMALRVLGRPKQIENPIGRKKLEDQFGPTTIKNSEGIPNGYRIGAKNLQSIT